MNKINLEKTNKNLSICVKLFKQVSGGTFKDAFDNIVIRRGEVTKFNIITFYNNLQNKMFYLVFVLYSEKNLKILGTSIIYDQEKLQVKYKEKGIEPHQTGIFEGVVGQFKLELEEYLEEGEYELIVFSKEIETLDSPQQERIKIKESYTYLENYTLASSAPFSLVFKD